MAARKPGRKPGLPSREQLLDFIAASPTPIGKREVAKAFKVRAADRVALKGLFKDILRSGEVAPTAKRRVALADALPEIAVIEFVSLSDEGEPVCRLLGADDSGPTVHLAPASAAALGVGQRATATLRKRDDGSLEATVLRKLEPEGERVLGVFTRHADGGGTLTSTDRRHKVTYQVRPTEALRAEDGELLLGAPLPLPRLGLPHIQILERLGRLDDPRAISLIAIHTHSIPVAFSDAALVEAAEAKPVALGNRTDLRAIPLVTIDGADARDFDDAVWAEPDPDVEGGWHILVAIADVAWYVRPGGALDHAAEPRGNSVYFPDRVVPMLPEALSNELCSLKPDVDRACMAIHMWLDADGKKTRHQVVRGLMRSAARLTYEQVQAIHDGTPSALADTVVAPLYGAYRALDRARRARGTLDLDLPERRAVLGADGKIERIEARQRLDSHKLIEEFMIAANVAAAETLEQVKRPCMYRVHDTPDPERLEALRNVLDSLGIHGLKMARGQSVRPKDFARVLEQAEGRPEAPLINDLVLRCQAQAVYAPENLGHFGLALQRYAHFTSPIRRYADLLVHRALIDGLHLGEGGLPPVKPADFTEMGAHLSRTERRATLAERTANDRYVVAFMADRVGASFAGRVSGVTRFGLFVTLDETGADGLIPISTLPSDYYRHDEAHHCLIGQRTQRRFTLGDRLEIKLVEADPIAGGLVFNLTETAPGGKIRQKATTGRPKNLPRRRSGRK